MSHNDSHDKNVIEIPLINQSSDIIIESESVPLEPQHIHIKNQNIPSSHQRSNPSSPPQPQGYNSQNLHFSNNNTPYIINSPQAPHFLMQQNNNNNPAQTKGKLTKEESLNPKQIDQYFNQIEIYIGNAQQQQQMQYQPIPQQFGQQQQGMFNPQMQMLSQQQMQMQMMQNPQQQMMMMQNQQQQQMLMQQQVQPTLPTVQLTPEEIARKKKILEDKQKFKRFIPEENPENMKVQSGYQSTLFCLGNCCGCLGQYCPCCNNPMQQVNNSYRGIYERFGKYVKTVEAGLHFVNPCTDKLIQIDMKTQVIDLGKQESVTLDNILVFVHGIVQYRVLDCRMAFYSIDNIDFSVRELSICALRSTISQCRYQDLLDNKEHFRKKMEEFVEQYIHDWGVDVEQIIIRDMNMDPNIQQQLSSAAKEVRLAQAKILNAKADVVAAEQQRKAADQLSSKAAMQIRYLSTLERIASRSKVVFFADEN